MSTFKAIHSSSPWLPTLTAIVCVMTAGPVIAAPADEVPSVTVSYADLDLSTPFGAQTLYQRIKRAASKVCAPLASKQLARAMLWRDCYEQAVANAVTTINRPTLTALHRASSTARG